MSSVNLRNACIGLVGLVAAAGLAGCQCTGQGAPRKTASGPKGGQPNYAYQQEDLILDRLDRMQMDMDSRFSGLQSDVNDIRTRQLTAPAPAPAVEYVAPPPAASQTVAYEIPVEPAVVELPQMRPVVQRQPALSANRSTLASKHLRVPGVTVRQLQEALAAAGCNPGKIDGKMGKQTIEAIRQFQRSYGLTVDGICGKNTWAWLQNVTAVAGAPTTPLK